MQPFLMQKKNISLAKLLNPTDFSAKSWNISFTVWNRSLKICLGSETAEIHLYHPHANCVILDEFYAQQNPNPIYRLPHFFLEDTSLYLTHASPG